MLWFVYLVLALSFGDVVASDFDLWCHQTLEQIGTVQSEQESDLLGLCDTTDKSP